MTEDLSKMTIKTGKLSTEEFACAIIAACPYNTSIKAFVGLLTSLSHKERNNDWLRVCQILKGSSAPVNRKWRRWAHNFFITNLVEVEHIIWGRILYICNSEVAAASGGPIPEYELNIGDAFVPTAAVRSMNANAISDSNCCKSIEMLDSAIINCCKLSELIDIDVSVKPKELSDEACGTM